MQRKWRREWEHRKEGQLAARSTNYGRGVLKTLTRTILPPVAAATMLLSSMIMPAYANPTGGQITAGTGSIAQTGNTMNITQNTNKLSINWQSFNIAKNETVNFQQPGAGAIALNRVVGNNASSIYGHLNANGQVFLINTNGVLFAPGSAVKVGGLVASTLNISDRDFQNGNYKFSGTGGSVVNQGALTATDGGYVALLGNQVANQGVILANQGTVALGAGNAATLDFNGDGLYSLAVDEAALNAQVDNQNLIQANGGQVYMTARAANALAGSVLNNSGVIEAQSIVNKNGVIVLDGGTAGAVTNSGTLDASGRSAGQTGGTVKVLGDNLTLAAGTKIDVSGANGGGTVLIGGNAHGQGSEQNATATTVANGATIDADAITSGNGGKVVVWADDATDFAGTISARGGSAYGDGGSVETSGKKLTIADSALVTTLAPSGKAGTWLLDPDGFTIGLTTADGNLTASALTNALALNNVTIASTSGSGTDGNINVNASVSWSANTLTLNATNNIYVNSTLTATGTANFAANYGQVLDANGNPTATASGAGNSDGTVYGLYTANTGNGSFTGKINFSGTGGVTLNGTNYTAINDAAGLAGLAGNGNYVLGSDIDLSSITDWTPLSDLSAVTLNGFGHVVDKLASTQGGLFGGTLTDGNISNLGVTNAAVTVAGATSSTGILAGSLSCGSLANVFTSGTLDVTQASSAYYVGGLVGKLGSSSGNSTLYNSYSTAGITAGTAASASGAYAGGLIGQAANATTIAGSWFSGDIKYRELGAVGGLVGYASGKTVTITNSYATADITPLNEATSMLGAGMGNGIGGFIGANYGSNISNCYATGDIVAVGSGWNVPVGGFAGFSKGTITNAYATGRVTNKCANPTALGGFVGMTGGGTINNAYAAGEVTSTSSRTTIYGFVGYKVSGTLTNVYYDQALTGCSSDSSTTSTGLSGDAAKHIANYINFDSNIWGSSTDGHPILKTTPVYVSAASPITYGGTYQASDFAYAGLQWGDTASRFTYDANGYLSFYGLINAGLYDAGDLLTSAGYSNILGTISVLPKTVVITGAEVAGKTYDGTTVAAVTTAGSVSDGVLAGESISIAGTGAYFSDKNVGADKTVDLNYGFTYVNGQSTGNYVVGTTATATITPKTISASFTAPDKTYDGTAAATAESSRLTGVIGADGVSVNYMSALFADQNAGTDKTVTFSGLTLSGTDSGNYALESTTAQTTANISPLTVSLFGSKAVDGTATISGSDLYVKNAAAGDTVTLSGTATISGSSKGIQNITDLSGLTLNNSNYTLTGSTGVVAVGDVNLVPDQVVSGTATITSSGNTTTITTSDKAVIDWLRFSIAANETVDFEQPSATSIVLNRVTGNEKSVIDGVLTSGATSGIKGRVFLINANGVLFAAGSRVDVGALVASTLDITNRDFLNNNYIFTADGEKNGSLVAAGDIFTVDGGFAILVSNNGVTDTGTITALGGDALLVAADSLTINSSDSGLTGYTISGLNGTTTMGGVVNMAATNGNGGLLETAGNTVTLSDGYQVGIGSNGTWSLSLPAITIGSDGNFTTLFVQNNLALRNLSLNALAGDITVNDAVNWSGNTILTLGAEQDININKSITAAGDRAGLVMNYGGDYNLLTPASYSGTILDEKGNLVAKQAPTGIEYAYITLAGSNASLEINGNAYTLIRSLSELDALDGYDAAALTGTASDVSGYYALAQDLDATGTTYKSAPISTLSGTLAGLGHTITGLTINNGSSDGVGLAGQTTSTSVIRDIGLTNVNINGHRFVGTLAGTNGGTIKDAWVSGTLTGAYGIGGLVGVNSGTIASSYVNVAVSGTSQQIGGLVGTLSDGTIVNSCAVGEVNGGSRAGGLVGEGSGTITNCYATGNVTGAVDLGGLVGYFDSGAVSNSYAAGSVASDGGFYLGGLIGETGSGVVTISHCGATGNVTSTEGSTAGLAGGLVGVSSATTTIDSCYALGNLTTNSSAGGLVGMNYGTITNSHAAGNITGSSATEAFGGLAGENFGTIDNCYATGNVVNTAIAGGDQGDIPDGTGGLVGTNNTGSTITNSWASGDVTILGGAWQSDWGGVGGLIGSNGGSVDSCTATGSVNGTGSNVGGLVGGNFSPGGSYSGTVTNSTYHDVKAERAAAEANGQAAAEDAVEQSAATQQTAEPAGNGPQTDMGRQSRQTMGDSMQNLLDLLNPANLFQSTVDDRLAYSDLGSYSAHIKSIFANGVEYQVEDNGSGDEDNSAK